MTKKDLDEPLIPKRCKDCKYMCISQASGLIRLYGQPVATCKLNHVDTTYNELRGTYVPCLDVIFLNSIYKCKYDKERLA